MREGNSAHGIEGPALTLTNDF